MGNRESKQAKQSTAAAAEASAGTASLSPALDPSNAPREAALGEWESPITSTFITEKAVKLSDPYLRASDGVMIWLESRSNEGGRQVLVMRKKNRKKLSRTPREATISTSHQPDGRTRMDPTGLLPRGLPTALFVT
ncbi:hypothetical protein Vafri_17860 [Volvox africanus]|uniref:Uncharacterized protein n=1 Tax=Volvox africanus TaxID=51714 RepID=A0A8J4FB93_9CHLO|nr:hypothetical protein Vafri_17860 [Volvox africanus]